MIFWLDAHLSPGLARWITERFGISARAVHDLGLRDAEDEQIFEAARRAEVVVITKDRDFVEMVPDSDDHRRWSG
jgi:predicted nuclease of predicted toxin-antitoxin system